MRFVQPEVVVSHFHIREGETVADFGAGSGFFLKVLSEAVGPEGLVYACEIQKALVDTLGKTAEREGLSNVRPMWCDFEKPEGSKLPEGSIDVLILVNTFFQVEHKSVVVDEMSRVLRSGGKAIVIDWTESWSGLGPPEGHVVTKTAAQELFEAGGFTFETDFDAGDHHYGITFRSR